MAMRLGDKTKFALAVTLAAAPVAASWAAQDQPATTPEMQKLLQDCDAHKFETTIHVTGDDGQPHDSDVKVCGKKGQNDADWIVTLKGILDQTAASQEMPQAVKDQVITALNAEIGRLTALLPREDRASAGLPAPRAAPKDDLASGYSSLPPMPPPVTEARPVAIPPAEPGSAPVAVAPVSSPPPAAAVPVAGAPVVAAPVAPGPRLTLRCVAGRDISLAEPCDPIERGNLLLVEAQESMDSGVLLKFYRRGEPRGELRLPPMRAGQPVTATLPDGLCSGVVRTRVEIRASRAPGSTETILGPYDLRC